jgi:hypothetical protein
MVPSGIWAYDHDSPLPERLRVLDRTLLLEDVVGERA